MTDTTQTPTANETLEADAGITPAEAPAANEKNSGEDAQAQSADQPETDKTDQSNQSDYNQDLKDTDNEDSSGEDKKDGNQEAQTIQYEPFNIPEGVEIDQNALNEAIPVLQKLNATQDEAQKLVDIHSSILSNMMKNLADQHNARIEGWKKQTHETFGKDGDARFQERVGRAEEMIKRFFPSEDDKTFLSHYGAGNHPGVFAMALALAEGTGEDRPSFNTTGNGTNGQKTLAEVWYPTET